MFTSKKLFSEVTCPHQDSCVLPRCIFGHPKSKLGSGAETLQDEQTTVDDQQGQRKKQKLAHDSSTTEGRQLGLGGVNKVTAAKATPENKFSKSRFDADREISPPPLRAKTANGKIVQPGFPSSHALSTPTTAETPLKTPVKASSKAEALIPRALKSPSPAAFDSRLRLLRALKEHVTRLNSELVRDARDSEEELVLSEQALITMCLDIEEEAAASPAIYSNLVKNKILIYKRMTMKQWIEERRKVIGKLKALEAASMSDTPVSKPSEPPVVIETGLDIHEELTLLHRLYTPIAGLAKHGYVTEIPSETEIKAAKQGIEMAQGWEVCDRCKSRFQVFPGRREEDGALTSGGLCTYHYGKTYLEEKSALNPKAKRVKKFRCCGESMGDSAGCTQGGNHVFKISEVKRLASILNFAKTPENLETVSDRPVCIDGEMGYTVYGLELIRLTATSWPNGEPLFDVLVRPIGPILDLNSRYSGVWPKHMAEALPWSVSGADGKDGQLRIVDSPAAARELLFSYLSPATPLIGHGLENDLNAVRIIHPIIIDTALLYPHKAGLPYRNGLKALMHMHLKRHIQVIVDGKMDGHDSKEDANAAGDLVRFALSSEWAKLQRAGWTVKDGVFKPATPQKPPPLDFEATTPPKEDEERPAKIWPENSAGRKRSRGEWDADAVDGEVEE